ncbi:30S ribosomal protein S1 [Oceanirhabdus sp. W0125-5]|uniref:30S ribosomal protein S1 n=1 Tax=Oceanirhabdus sp. W0125-5 TaxID=2999116 RepID=UPI0022F340C9|nr:30S ribosomal protein S1 [Oceanirhabdus sp. W0125-5]WBW99324.1 30S ribosomal protein S1 [Oceanirhabdus sp. W0125-5]
MTEQHNDMNEMINEIEASMKRINSGEILEGKVITVNENEAIINIGHMADGILPKNEISNEDIDPRDVLKVDDIVKVYVVKSKDENGNVLLSKKRADAVLVWDELEAVMNKEETLTVKVKEVVKGGVITDIKGVRGFIPASQLSADYVKDLSAFVGVELEVKIIELDKSKKKLVLSRRVIEVKEREEKKKELFATIKAGEKRKGVVTKTAKYGAFVDIGGIEGLVHITELSWKRVKSTDDVVKVGDEVEVFVLSVDSEKGRVSLSMKDTMEHPWDKEISTFKTGDVVDAKIVKIMDFGAFAKLNEEIEGLIHISQISEEKVANIKEVLNIGDTVKVKIINIDKDKRKIGLSIKEAIEKPVINLDEFNDEDDMQTLGDLFGDKLKNLDLK